MSDTSKIDPQTRISRNEDHVSSEIDGETVLMSIEKGKYYGMNDIGSRIWKLLAEPITFQDLHDTLVKEFEGDSEQIRIDTLHFLEGLKKEDLVRYNP